MGIIVRYDGTQGVLRAGLVFQTLNSTYGSNYIPSLKDKEIKFTKDNLSVLNAAIIKGLTLSGTDPEVFVTGKEGIIPAWKILPSPEKASENAQNGTKAYWDGLQAEISLKDGYGCHEYTTDRVRNGLETVYNAALLVDKSAQLLCEDVVEYDMREVEMEYSALGCAPSENIYNIPPIDVGIPGELPYRFAGTHLHYSTTTVKRPSWFPHGVVAMMDRTAGVLLTALGRGMENPLRRKYYGRPGEFRAHPTQTRLEYRTPGAFVSSCPAVFNFALDTARAGFLMGLSQDGREIPMDSPMDIILNCDAAAAVKYIKKYEKFYTAMITRLQYPVDHTFAILRTGVKSLLKPVVKEWKLDGREWKAYNDDRKAGWYVFATNRAKL